MDSAYMDHTPIYAEMSAVAPPARKWQGWPAATTAWLAIGSTVGDQSEIRRPAKDAAPRSDFQAPTVLSALSETSSEIGTHVTPAPKADQVAVDRSNAGGATSKTASHRVKLLAMKYATNNPQTELTARIEILSARLGLLEARVPAAVLEALEQDKKLIETLSSELDSLISSI